MITTFLPKTVRMKLRLAIVVTLMSALTITSTVFVTTAYQMAKKNQSNELVSLARVVAANSSAAVVFHDSQAAEEYLESLFQSRSIITATITDIEGKVLAGSTISESESAYDDLRAKLDKVNPAHRSGYFSDREKIYALARIQTYDTVVGHLYISSSTRALRAQAQSQILLTISICLIAMAVAFGLFVVLDRRISGPLSALAETMLKIRTEKKYSQRVAKTTNDEYGHLIDSFNSMLNEIEIRDQNLESEVGQRTMDLESAVQTLELEVEEHTKTEARLQIEKERAEEASRAKTDFLANMSHELRTPLNAIIGFSEIMTEKIYGTLGHNKYDEYSVHIMDSGRRLLNIINSILDYSKFSSNKMELHEEEVSLVETIESAAKLLIVPAAEKNFDIQIQDGPDILLFADEVAIVRIMTNLLSNALKFSSDGGHVKVNWEECGNKLIICAKDNGIGIRPQKLEQVLEPFVQNENVMVKRHEGTGLGLPLAKALAELHGGTLHIDSEFGAWTEVSVEIPASRICRDLEGSVLTAGLI